MMRPKHKLHATADPARRGILTAKRQAGQQRAAKRAADYQGFTKTVPRSIGPA